MRLWIVEYEEKFDLVKFKLRGVDIFLGVVEMLMGK